MPSWHMSFSFRTLIGLTAGRRTRGCSSLSCPPFSHQFLPRHVDKLSAYVTDGSLPSRMQRHRLGEMRTSPSLCSSSSELRTNQPSQSGPFCSPACGVGLRDREKRIPFSQDNTVLANTVSPSRLRAPLGNATAEPTRMRSHGNREVSKKERRDRGEQPSARMSQDHPGHTLRTPSLSKIRRIRWRTLTVFPCAPSCSPPKPSVACRASLVLCWSGYSPPGTHDSCSSGLPFPVLPSFPSQSYATTTSGSSCSISRVSLSFCRPVPCRPFVVSLAAPSSHAAGSSLCQELTTPQSGRGLGQLLPIVNGSLNSPRNRAVHASTLPVSPCLTSLKCCTAPVPSLPSMSFLSSYFSGHALSLRRRALPHPCSAASTSSAPRTQWQVSHMSLLCSSPFASFSSFFRPFSFFKCKEDSELPTAAPARRRRRRPEGISSFSLPGFLFPSSGQLKLNYHARRCLSSSCISGSFSKIPPVSRLAPGTLARVQAKHLSFSRISAIPSSFRAKHSDGYFSRGGNPVSSGPIFPAASADLPLLSCTSAFTVRSLVSFSAQSSFRKQLAEVSCIPSHRGHAPKANTCTICFYSPPRSPHTSTDPRNTFRPGIGCVPPENKTVFLRDLPSWHSVDRAGQVISPAVFSHRGTRTVTTEPHWYPRDNWKSSMLSSQPEAFDQDSDDGSEEEEVGQGPDQHAGFGLGCGVVGKQQARLNSQGITRRGGDSGLSRKGGKKQQKTRGERSSAARPVFQKEARMEGHPCLRNAAMQAKKIGVEEDEAEGSSPLLDAFASLKEKRDGESAPRRARGLDDVRRSFPPLSGSKRLMDRHLFSPVSRDDVLDGQDNAASCISLSEAASLPLPPRDAPSAMPSSLPLSSSWEFCETIGSSSVLSALSAEMAHLEKAMLPGVEQTNAMKTFLSQLQDLLSGGVLEACVVTPFGSAVNGLWTPQSDLDVCLQVKGAYTRAQQIKVLRQIAHALHPVQSHIIEPRFQARVPIIHWAPRFQASGHLSGGTILDSQGSEDQRSAALGNPQQRNYIVKDGRKQGMEGGGEPRPRRTGQPSMVACDISVNNLLAVVNSKLLGAYVHTDTRLRTLGYSVKWWAKGRNINDRARGTVSSFSLILMLIHFLQRHANPPVLPSLQDIAIRQQAPPVYIGGVDCRYTSDRTAIERELAFLRNGRAANTRSPGMLLLQFFHYYGYEYKGGVISIRDTTGFTRESHPSETRCFFPGEKTAAARRRGGPRWTLEEQARVCVSGREQHSENDFPGPLANSLSAADIHNIGGDYLVVDNPFEVGKDVCNVLPCQYQRIRHEFRRAFRMLSEGSTLRQVAAPDGRSALRW